MGRGQRSWFGIQIQITTMQKFENTDGVKVKEELHRGQPFPLYMHVGQFLKCPHTHRSNLAAAWHHHVASE